MYTHTQKPSKTDPEERKENKMVIGSVRATNGKKPLLTFTFLFLGNVCDGALLDGEIEMFRVKAHADTHTHAHCNNVRLATGTLTKFIKTAFTGEI